MDASTKLTGTQGQTPSSLSSERSANKPLCNPYDFDVQGHPLKCKFCPDALLLNSTSLKQHLESKRHKKLQPKDYEDISVCAADEHQDEESVSSML